MGRYKKILVAFDGSESSLNALLQAFRLASEEECWITAATVIPQYEGELDLTGVGDVHEPLRRAGEEILSKAKTVAKESGALIKTILEEGESSERLVSLAEEENCGLIVMGRRGKSRLERAMIGSVAARVIGLSKRDVLVMPENSHVGWKKILVATDGSKYSAAASDRAIDFARSHGGTIQAVSVVDVPAEFYAEAPKAVEDLTKKAKGFVADVKKKAEASGIKTTTFIGEGEAYKVITDLARDENSDVIFVGSRGRTGLTKILMGSVTEKVIGYSSCPVLVVKNYRASF